MLLNQIWHVYWEYWHHDTCGVVCCCAVSPMFTLAITLLRRWLSPLSRQVLQGVHGIRNASLGICHPGGSGRGHVTVGPHSHTLSHPLLGSVLGVWKHTSQTCTITQSQQTTLINAYFFLYHYFLIFNCIKLLILRAQELCESRGDHPQFPVPKNHYGVCGC